jgi:hypothetical protein
MSPATTVQHAPTDTTNIPLFLCLFTTQIFAFKPRIYLRT